jgi:uncharacterized protein YbjT (DUF2867 family)
MSKTDHKILVVGATGQLGGVVVKRLAQQGIKVRALSRPQSVHSHLRVPGVEVVLGDLMDPSSLAKACDGMTLVISTATAHIPRFADDDFRLVDDIGYANLIEACRKQAVSRFVFCSGIATPHDHWIPLMKLKRKTETRLMSSGLNYTIVRASAFMDIAFVLMGSSIPIVGAEVPTVKRPFRFARKHIESIENSIEHHGVAHLPGDGKRKHSFISSSDVADFLINAGLSPDGINTTLEVGGPEALSWFEIVRVYEELLGVKLKTKTTPAFVFRNLSRLFSLFSAPASNLMAINYLFAATDAVVPEPDVVATRFGVTLKTASDFLEEKFELKQKMLREG